MTMASLLALPAIKAIESAFNRYLSLDPDSPGYLRPLLGKVVQINVAGLGVQFIFVFTEQQVQVCHEFGAEANAVIRGAPLSLAAVASGRAGLMQSGITIEGEVDTANRFSQLMGRIDVDWEEHIAGIAGDTPAHLLGRFKTGASGWVKQLHTGMERNIADYLRDETHHLPYRWEMDEFIEEVDNLRDRVGRLLSKAQSIEDRKP